MFLGVSPLNSDPFFQLNMYTIALRPLKKKTESVVPLLHKREHQRTAQCGSSGVCF